MSGAGANATTAGRSADDARPAELAPPAWAILVAAAIFALDQWLYERSGAATVRQAPLDWIGHVLTMLLIAWAAGSLFRRRWLISAVVASVAIDVDHIPRYLGSSILTAGTSRPFTHSLATVLVLLAFSVVASRWRDVAIGAAFGVAGHLWRDLAEPHGSGVALLWPLSDQTLSTPAAAYLGSVGALALVALGRRERRVGALGARGR